MAAGLAAGRFVPGLSDALNGLSAGSVSLPVAAVLLWIMYPVLAGVRYRSIVFAVYVFCALCAGVAGLMIASNISAADANNAGLWIEMDAILAVVIGGTSLLGGRFSLTGTILGALIIQTLTTTVYTAGITPETTLVFKALVVIAVCLLQAPKFRAVVSRRGPRGPRPDSASAKSSEAQPVSTPVPATGPAPSVMATK